MQAEHSTGTYLVGGPKADIEHTLATVGWGLFFLWVGISVLSGLSTGVGLVGIGLITLGVQAARLYLGLGLEGFWFAVGLLFGLGGLAAITQVDIPVLPIVLVVAGALLLVSVVKGKR
jgi:hypothetical protein